MLIHDRNEKKVFKNGYMCASQTQAPRRAGVRADRTVSVSVYAAEDARKWAGRKVSVQSEQP